MSKIDKIIKDLKERNDKLLEQYRYRDIRCITLEKRLEMLEKENKQLKDNWNKVKEYINKWGGPFVDGYGYIQIEDNIIYANDLLDEMQELEKGENNEKN